MDSRMNEAGEIIAFEGEILLLSWRESHNNGATVTFQLADVEDLEAFKRMTVRKGKRAGQRLMAVLVEIGEDERPVVQEKKGGPLSQSAALLCGDPMFQKFAEETLPELEMMANFLPSDRTAHQVRFCCGIKSRSELDHDEKAARRFHELMREYRQWGEK